MEKSNLILIFTPISDWSAIFSMYILGIIN